jgi:hypothetical protein
MRNEKVFGLNQALSGYNRQNLYPLNFSQWRGGFITGQQKPSDYRIVFGPMGTDTSTQFLIDDLNQTVTPAIPTNFKVFNTSENRQIEFAFLELDGAGGPGIFSAAYDPNFPANSRSDYIIFLERDLRDSLATTWNFTVTFDSTRVVPTDGDTATIVLSKLFRLGDVFEFETDTQRVDAEIAKSSLDKIRVVPNPYVAAATWEERNPFSSGRGPRSIHFTHLPQVCTIRIFTISGELVAEIKHNGEMLDGTAEWNMLTRDNLSVAYGVYIYHVDAGSVGEKVGKFAIIK